MDDFIHQRAQQFARIWGGRALRVLDIGCGSGYACTLLEQGGLSGEYIGVDHELHPSFEAVTSAQFARRHISTDILNLDPNAIGSVDLLVSMTSLEHFEDDVGALQIARRCLAPGGGELHIVPAEDGLRLWETHGWRQYSPGCVQSLCPSAALYRIGGAASAFTHYHLITKPNRAHVDWRSRHPKLYRAMRSFSLALDPICGNRPASLYAAVISPTRTTQHEGEASSLSAA